MRRGKREVGGREPGKDTENVTACLPQSTFVVRGSVTTERVLIIFQNREKKLSVTDGVFLKKNNHLFSETWSNFFFWIRPLL